MEQSKVLSVEERNKMSIRWVDAILDRREYERWQERFDDLTEVLTASELLGSDEETAALAGVGFVNELKQLFRAIHNMHRGKAYKL